MGTIEKLNKIRCIVTPNSVFAAKIREAIPINERIINDCNTVKHLRQILDCLTYIPPYPPVKPPLKEGKPITGDKPKTPTRSGGPRKPETNRRHGQPKEELSKAKLDKHEIVCRQEINQWIVGLEISDTSFEANRVKIYQCDSPLECDPRDTSFWPIPNLNDDIEIMNVDNSNISIEQICKDEKYVLFQLVGENLHRGRRVKRYSKGAYLLLAPKIWSRNENISGPPPYEPEPVAIGGYIAHFFIVTSDDDHIALLDEYQQSINLPRSNDHFTLIGNKLEEGSQYVGPLFGSDLPKLKAKNTELWKKVGYIVVIEEGVGQGRQYWIEKISQSDQLQELPHELIARDGWYSVRIYDTDHKFFESMEFRYISSLKSIEYLCSSLPVESGHSIATVRFLHNEKFVIKQHGGKSSNVELKPSTQSTELVFPAHYELNKTTWSAGSIKPNIEIMLLLERVWWNISDEYQEPNEWIDVQITLDRRSFTATSNRALWISLPRPRWTEEIHAGFDGFNQRPYKVKVNDDKLAIPLREFEYQTGQIEGEISFQIEVKGEKAIPIRVMPYLQCKYCEKVIPQSDILAHLQEHIKPIIDDMYISVFREEINLESNSRGNSKISIPHDTIQGRWREVNLEEAIAFFKKSLLSTETGRIDTTKEIFVYKCMFCGGVVFDNSEKGARNKIDLHQKGKGAYFMKWPEIIPSGVMKETTVNVEFAKCNRCGCEFKGFPQEQLINHLIKEHREQLFTRI